MFNLEKEVDAWCRAVHGRGWGQNEQIEELQDHLYCEIERLQNQGLDEEQAFLKATQRLGPAADLGAEFAKNRTVLSTLCAIEQAQLEAQANHGLSPRQTTAITIGHALLFAAAILIVPLLVNSGDSGAADQIIFGVLIPLWFATSLLLPGTRHSVKREWRYLKRVFGFGR